MKLKVFNKDILKRNLAIISSVVFLVTSTSCMSKEEKLQNYILDEYDLSNIIIEESKGFNIPFVCINNNIYNGELINKLSKDMNISNDYGLIINPCDITYSSIYKSVDLVKDIVNNYKMNAPILYNIDIYMEDEYIGANCKLAIAFLDKLTSNGICAGLYGSQNNMDKFLSIYNNYVTYDISKYIKVTDTNSEDLFESLKYIRDNRLNVKDKFLLDYRYVVRNNDSLYSIAELHNIKLDDLLDYNDLTIDSTIMPGEIIVIPNIYNEQSTVNNRYKFDECSIGIDLSEYNCIPTGDVINYELTEEIKSKLGSEQLAKVSLGNNYIYLDNYDDVYFYEHTYDHLDWNDIKQEVDFVGLRIGDFWLSKEGNIIFDEDEEFRYNLENCVNNNIPYYTYYVTSSNTIDGQIKESEYIMRLLLEIGYDRKHPIFIDIEPNTSISDNLFNYDATAINAFKAGLSSIDNNGFVTGIYCSEVLRDRIIKIDELKDYTYWSTCTKSFLDYTNIMDSEISNLMDTYRYYPNDNNPIIQLSCKGKSYIVPLSLQGDNGIDIDVASKKFIKKLY